MKISKAVFGFFLLVSIVMGFSCAVSQDTLISESGSIIEQKKEAQSIMDKAHEDFFKGVADQPSKSSGAKEGFSVKDTIIGLAWNALYSGDTTELVSYLKETKLYQKYLEIVAKYNLTKCQEILDKPSGVTATDSKSQSSSFFTSSSRYSGDIFLCTGGGSVAVILGVLIPGHWDHAGMMDRAAPNSSAPILSASDETSHGFGVGYETINKWTKKSSVIALRVKGYTTSKGQGAVNYSKQFLGKPYNIFASRDSNSDWYCSKVVWRGWKSQGKDLEYNTWYYFRGVWVTPQDLYEDSDTYYVAGDKW